METILLKLQNLIEITDNLTLDISYIEDLETAVEMAGDMAYELNAKLEETKIQKIEIENECKGIIW